MLVAIDSLTSFIDQAESHPRDPGGFQMLRSTIMWCRNVVNATAGEVAFLLISQANAGGQAYGRALPYKSDAAISITSDPEEPLLKEISVTKSWRGKTGKLGTFLLDPERATLTLQGEA